MVKTSTRITFVCFGTAYSYQYSICDRLVGLVVKESASGMQGPGFDSRLRWDISGSSHTSDLKIGTQVATLPGARHTGSALGLVGPVSVYCGWVR